MVTLFYIMLGLALWHFLYESVIAPSLRHTLRYKFFKLRDELRDIKFEGLTIKEEKAYKLLETSICNLINGMNNIHLANYYSLNSLYKKEDIKKLTEIKKSIIIDSENKDLIKIDRITNALGARSLLVNNGAWFLYFSIPLIVILIFSYLLSKLTYFKLKVVNVSTRLIYSNKIFEDNNLEIA